MVQPIKDIFLAWNSLDEVLELEGWKTIFITELGTCQLMAGRYFPDNVEAILVFFHSESIPSAETLPESNGFLIEKVDPFNDNKSWISLTRKQDGSVELFQTMVADIVSSVESKVLSGETHLLKTFLHRVRAWQEFMRKGTNALGPEAELGLVGELQFISDALKLGVSPYSVIDSWKGPLDNPQDFEIGTGAIEVKASLSTKGFVAKIGSLEQLDNSLRQPLYVTGLRFSQIDIGMTLPELVESVKSQINFDSDAIHMLEEKLMLAGFFKFHIDRYVRRFKKIESLIYLVDDEFPRIVLGTIPSEVIKVRYEIDLDKIILNKLDLPTVFNTMGVL